MKKVKISHLFHWLYAILMLLPAFAIGVSCLYAVFNKNAYQSYSDEYVVAEYNVTNSTILQDGFDYSLNIKTFIEETNEQSIYTPTIYPKEKIDWSIFDNTITNDMVQSITHFEMIRANATYTNIFLYDSNNTRLKNLSKTNSNWLTYDNEQLILHFYLVSHQTDANRKYGNYLIQYNYATEKLDNVFYYSIDKVQQSPLFSWSFDSFLAEPFEYITDVFSIPHGNIIVFFASYWLAISIIWLCFDLVMYVPNLVHKWLDKGSIS